MVGRSFALVRSLFKHTVQDGHYRPTLRNLLKEPQGDGTWHGKLLGLPGPLQAAQ